MRRFVTLVAGLVVAVGCGGGQERAAESHRPVQDFAIAIHGGAGSMDRGADPERERACSEALSATLTMGRDMLAGGASALDVVEQVIRRLEDDPLFNAGKGAVFTHEGTNELDAAIMDGSTLGCGSVTGVTTVKNPITLARKVMENSRHVFFSGRGAEAFADSVGVERVDPKYFFTQRRWDALQKRLAKDAAEAAAGDQHGTVGAVALDRYGHLAAATSTGGLTDKRFGRVGDVPVIGAGTYADDRTAAISCTGIGEEFIRHTVAARVSAMIEFGHMSVNEAADQVINHVLKPGDGGLIAVGRDGEIAMVFNTEVMFRGAADAGGRFDVAIFGRQR